MTNYIAAFIDELHLLGVTHVVISPGSRSTPLSMLFCEGDFKTHIAIDERSAGFFALGIAKELGKPVVLVCTSGTAASNYLPAVTEASISNVPLIVLTSDRPHELRNVGAPQSINQNNMYSNYVKSYEELALPEESEESYKYVRTTADRLYTQAMMRPYGVVHINVPLRDPLVPNFDELDFTSGRRKYNYNFWEQNRQCNIYEEFFRGKNGIILCGTDVNSDYHNEVLCLSKKLKAPILADPLSNLRSMESENVIYTYDSILKNEDIFNELKADYIIHFGGVIVSKPLNQFIKFNKDTRYFQIAPQFQYISQTLSITDYIITNENSFVNSITLENYDSKYLNKWIHIQKEYSKSIENVSQEKEMFEGKIIKIIEKSMKEDTRLFVSNSMVIRYIDSFYHDKYKKDIKVICNRGANGIDGTVSTAMGVSKVSENTVLLIGDLSFYHDMNGLLIGNKEECDLVIVLLNNDGGGIFRFLPQSLERNFDYLFLTEHGINFEALSKLYNINYTLTENYEDFEDAFEKAVNSKGINILEVRTDSVLSKKLQDKYTKL